MRLNQEGFGLGAFVERRSHEMRGRVINVHFSCPENVDWVLAQEPPIRAEALMPGYVWFSVLLDGGGSVVVPAYDLDPSNGFMWSNDWADEFFPPLCDWNKHTWNEEAPGQYVCGLCNVHGRWSAEYQRVMFVRGSDLGAGE